MGLAQPCIIDERAQLHLVPEIAFVAKQAEGWRADFLTEHHALTAQCRIGVITAHAANPAAADLFAIGQVGTGELRHRPCHRAHSIGEPRGTGDGKSRIGIDRVGKGDQIGKCIVVIMRGDIAGRPYRSNLHFGFTGIVRNIGRVDQRKLEDLDSGIEQPQAGEFQIIVGPLEIEAELQPLMGASQNLVVNVR